MSTVAVVVLFVGMYALVQLCFGGRRRLTTAEWMEHVTPIYRDALERLLK